MYIGGGGIYKIMIDYIIDAQGKVLNLEGILNPHPGGTLHTRL